MWVTKISSVQKYKEKVCKTWNSFKILRNNYNKEQFNILVLININIDKSIKD